VRAAAARVIASKGLKLGGELIDLLGDDKPAVREAAHTALLKLSKGADYGPAKDATTEEREEAGKKWRAWGGEQGERGGGRPGVRPMAARISTGVESGEALEELLRKETALLPPLFVALATVGEQTGMLPEVFRELEKFYLFQDRLRKQFLAQIAWPAFQLFAAILVITGLIWILGIITEVNPGSKGFDPIGLGTGAGPAMGFFCSA